MTDTLSPCPKCGSAAEIEVDVAGDGRYPDDGKVYRWIVVCAVCGTEGLGVYEPYDEDSEVSEAEKKAIYLWNSGQLSMEI